ncbi:hypothetical protein GCM10009122_55710 [Fulvivirga kasyanovii]|uniref:DUF1440 domain-containing protein n=1 Tax=Fulvivirga kasyanovii TaxID=396812 RepID=A0ABW9RUH7_9BACT|nr:hypothetical protein [Fulvivirga kasyanovii]MTI27842.1 hypothetical protein [Fulvivirga kasyanovii]
MKTDDIERNVGSVGSAIGRSLLAGIAGTVAITIAQMIEMKLSGREPSNAPAEVGGKVLGVEPRGGEKEEQDKKQGNEENSVKEQNEEKFGQLMHWGYGTGWGVCRGLLSLAGIKGPAATAIHFGAIWGTELVMVPAMTESPPASKWGAKALAKDALLHLTYALAAGAVFDAIDNGRD